MTDEERDLIERVGVAPTAYRYVHLDYAGRKISRYGAHAERVNGHDPIEAHALYEAGQIAALIEERDHAQTSASRDVMNERRRQSEEEGFSPEHDDGHTEGQLPGAGACYALWDVKHWAARIALKNFWPWSIDWCKPGDRRQNLVKAGALIIAEIERLDRAALQPKDADHD